MESLSNNDCEDNEKIQKPRALISKTDALHVQHTPRFFLHFFVVTAQLTRENSCFLVLRSSHKKTIIFFFLRAYRRRRDPLNSQIKSQSLLFYFATSCD